MRGVIEINGSCLFRISTNFYPLEAVSKVFGKDFRRVGEYLVFELQNIQERDVLEKLNELLGLVYGEI